MSRFALFVVVALSCRAQGSPPEEKKDGGLDHIKFSSAQSLGCAGMWISNDDGVVGIDTSCPIYGVQVKKVIVDKKQVWP